MCDLPAIARIAAQAWRWAYVDILPAAFIEERCDLEERVQRMTETWRESRLTLLACDEDGTPQGFVNDQIPCSLSGCDAEIGALYVGPTSARQGVGKLLVKAMAQTFLDKGHRSMAIQTLAENAIGRSFYEKIGGRLAGEGKWYEFPTVWYGWDDLSAVRL
ncbi:MAG: N-acetyltransferase family protein [Fimbriimonas sp.]